LIVGHGCDPGANACDRRWECRKEEVEENGGD
jgi:hypothetical protein